MADRRLIVGSLLILLGTVLVLDNFGFIPWEIRYYLTSWETIVIVIGIFLVTTRRNKIPGTIMILVGAFFLIPDIFNISRYEWRNLWPVLLIVFGLLILFRRKIHGSYRAPSGNGDIDILDDMNILGGGDKIVTSRNFRGGKVTNILGGGEYDLTEATLSGERNVVDVFCLFGGATFRVPKDWNVRVEVTPILGGFSDKRRTDPNLIPDPRKELFIRGVAILGGGEVKN